jgi:hypothetical protein
MTSGELVAQVQAVNTRHGGELPLYWIDPVTGQRYDIEVRTRPGSDTEGVYITLVPVLPVGVR